MNNEMNNVGSNLAVLENNLKQLETINKNREAEVANAQNELLKMFGTTDPEIIQVVIAEAKSAEASINAFLSSHVAQWVGLTEILIAGGEVPPETMEQLDMALAQARSLYGTANNIVKKCTQAEN